MFSKNKTQDQKNIPSKYSINLMWINRTLDLTKPYIFTYDNEKLIIEKIFSKVSKWVRANPQAEVNLWFDSKYTTSEGLKRTQSLLNKKALQDLSFAFNLKDIQQIDIVKQNADALSDNLPVYFRVDLLKLIICVHSIEYDEMEAAIFSDLEVGDRRKKMDRMNKKDYLNQKLWKD